jgi:3-keto-5-aminohexanoate cleavage enzyme
MEDLISKIIIEAALNGMRGREVSVGVPWTPEEVAAEARHCADAGASIVHFHARGPDGAPIYDAGWYAEADRLIRKTSDLIVNHTTGRLANVPLDDVLRSLRETPLPVDLVSLNVGNIAFNSPLVDGERKTFSIPNSYDDMRQIIRVCKERDIGVEPAVLDSGFLANLVMMVEDRLLTTPSYVLVEFSSGVRSGVQMMPGTSRSYFYMLDVVRDCFPEAITIAHGMDDAMFKIASLAIAAGNHVRLGFEDSALLANGMPARSNAEFVAWAVQLARMHGREPASTQETRSLIKLKG